MPGGWSVRLRTPDLHLADPIPFTSLTLIENYNAPDMLTLDASSANLVSAVDATGIVVTDEVGHQRFSGVMYGPRQFDSDGTGTIAYASDLMWLWRRLIYPDPTRGWLNQTAVGYDVASTTAEERILYYLDRDAGAGAAAAGRGVPYLRLPAAPAAGTGRGPVARTSARFDTLGVACAALAESGGMRLTMRQTYAAGDSRHLDVVLADAPDLSAWARYGTPEASGPGLLADGWRFAITAPVTNCVLVAAGGELTARVTREVRDDASISVWGRIETFLDQRQTTDATEIAQAGTDALAAGAAVVEIVAQISDSDGMRIGVDIPIGSKVSCVLNGQTFIDRVRSLTTTVAGGQAPTVTTVPVFGSPDVAIPITSAQITAMQSRISALERNT